MAQTGDPYAAEREARQQEARALFSDGNAVNQYAARAYREVRAGLFYLSRWRRVGAVEAGRLTCEQFGHEPRGRQCERCGEYVA